MGLPRFESASWRVEAMASSSGVSTSNEPVVCLNLRVKDPPHGEQGALTKDVAFTLTPASMGVLVEGMRKIKDQLSAVA